MLAVSGSIQTPSEIVSKRHDVVQCRKCWQKLFQRYVHETNLRFFRLQMEHAWTVLSFKMLKTDMDMRSTEKNGQRLLAPIA